VLFAQVVAPPGTPVEITEKVLDQVRAHFLQESGVKSVFTVSGLQFRWPRPELGSGVRQPERLGRGTRQWRQQRKAIVARANKYFSTIRGARWPPSRRPRCSSWATRPASISSSSIAPPSATKP
jgi:multidrug efflux pump subunit AcrB